MLNRVGVAAAVLFACALSLRGQAAFYQIDLVPSGSFVSKQAPVWKGGTLVFKKHPDGTLMSVKKSEVKKISMVSKAEEQASTTPQVIQIGNLAMAGGDSQAGAANANAVARRSSPQGLGQGFYGNVVPGQTQGMPNSANDNVVGKDWAYGPANATQSSPGAPPMMSGTGGQNPPTMPNQ